MADQAYNGRNLLPSPWTEMEPSIHTLIPRPRPDSEINSDHGSLSFTSTSSSPTCSPASSPRSATPRMHRFSPSSIHRVYSRSRSRNSTSSLRLPRIFVRRRPSSIDLALSEERSRCNEDSVERRGLGLMEPRPIEPIPVTIDTYQDSNRLSHCSGETRDDITGSSKQNPHYVMGGIFEVMEGSA